MPLYGECILVSVWTSEFQVEDYVDAAVKQAVTVHLGGMEGDVLIFMPGQVPKILQ